MIVNELKLILESFLIRWIKVINLEVEYNGLKIQNNVGFGEYVIITRLENHFVIELLGFQKISANPKFIIEDKPCSYDINFFINGGKKDERFSILNSTFDFSKHEFYKENSVISGGFVVPAVDRQIINELLVYPLTGKETVLLRKDGDLPIVFSEKTSNVLFHDFTIISKVNNHYSLRRHSTSIIVEKNIKNIDFKNFLKRVFNKSLLRKGKFFGSKYKYQLISELKSLAYHKVHETTIDKFLQLNSDLFAKSLGYISAKSNIRLQLQVNKDKFGKEKELIPDFMLERKDGYFDILDLKIGLLSYDFALGDWSNTRFSSYGQSLLSQLIGYKRYFSFQENADWAFKKYNIKLNKLKLIGIAGNHNNFNHEVVRLALDNHVNDFVLYSYNDLAKKMKEAL